MLICIRLVVDDSMLFVHAAGLNHTRVAVICASLNLFQISELKSDSLDVCTVDVSFYLQHEFTVIPSHEDRSSLWGDDGASLHRSPGTRKSDSSLPQITFHLEHILLTTGMDTHSPQTLNKNK